MMIEVIKTTMPKELPNPEQLGFGQFFTDHMFEMTYAAGEGWHNPQIIPFGDIVMSPAAMVLHYSQEMFEGMKAYVGPDGLPRLFRPEMNAKRLNQSNRRLCIPEIPEELFLEAVSELVKIDARFIPTEPGTSLYIRPFVFATEPSLMVKVSASYKFMIILSPVGAYYKEGLNPVRIWVEQEYVRAVVGGVGYAKTGGNYAAGLMAQEKAHTQGCSQVLWLDAKERQWIEEVGTMNIFFKIKGVFYTPPLAGSILPGVTRDSAIVMLQDMGYDVVESPISIHEIIEAISKGELEEAFGTGTAAVISPVGELMLANDKYLIGDGKTGDITLKLYEALTQIQYGLAEDPHGWCRTC